ncbi:trimethylamine-N-oxide reductase TorA [Aliarcobacter trophiarum LMG 25534]|uniref:Molybdopterin-containing oxidoreductase II, DMSO/TMAO/BSO reductase family, catalytic subunit n=1 Tax=Aliarcobacter trophiarum LMG 25534 TaxID=1032241 RepID=A0AAD0VN20_9BACT|nr:molybdopterin guanine dinucleotide-containing S/N-oxide reductase [Aliarcobacter trophiarum]AXK49744.1 molybdopterin-containing oxidoreductase II, DMSO/TMAO/BSO reductase family, catalytic subunit [Aliarcobacter trophiarum LMG 25534]RXI28067.1 trimethylamine-N-oxide reductase TorA [Aliarcobacter trophiarum]RXJ92479.1 trimethylamine-N-oxide reductase TorA [Aliarcobacter trophiarum LMG 25534]
MRKIDQKRRGVLKLAVLFAAVPFVDVVSNRTNLLAATVSRFSTTLVTNGEVLTAAHWGMLKLTIKDVKIVKSEPYQKTSDIFNSLQYYTQDLVYAKDRIKYPMVRKSYLENPNSSKPELRGKDEWVRVSYEEAIKLIAGELKKTREDRGAEGIFAGSYGWKSSGNMHNSRVLLHRFMNTIGGFTGSLGDYSTGAAQVIMPHVLGTIEVYEQQTSWPVVLESSKVVVIWGANLMRTLKISWTSTDEQGFKYLQELKKSNKQIICIDPEKNETCTYLDAKWVPITPGTDVALMMGMAYHLLKTDNYDKVFLDEYTEGFDEFKEYLLGKKDKVAKDTKWASKICGIDEATIKELALLMYNNRTMIMAGWGIQRAQYGEQTHWMIVTLASMLGQIGLAGGGFGFSYHYSNGGVPTAKGGKIGGITSTITSTQNTGGSSWLEKTAKFSFPVARIADALLNPGKVIEHNGSKITYPDIDFVYWVGGNPMVHHQDTNTLVKALRKPKTIVVNEIFWTPTARMADIVMPVTTSYERDDITMSGDYSNLNIIPMKQAVERQNEAKDDYDIFCDLAKEFGVLKDYSQNKTALEWIEEFYLSAYNQVENIGLNIPKFKEFWEANKPVTFEVPQENAEFVRYADYREDPILEPLGTPSGKIEIFSKVIENMNYDDCKGHPTWFEPDEWLGMKNKDAEFALITSHPDHRLHSQLNNTSLREKYAVANREPIFINKKDAKSKGIKDGDLVRVYNKRGEILAGAVLTDKLKRGVVRVDEGAWYDPLERGKIGTICLNGNVNVLTKDIPTSKLANGNSSNTALVNIEKYTKKAKDISIFKQP